jgi:hypothetical protein
MRDKISERLVCRWTGKQGPDSFRRAKSSRKIVSFFKKDAGLPHAICVQPGWGQWQPSLRYVMQHQQALKYSATQ